MCRERSVAARHCACLIMFHTFVDKVVVRSLAFQKFILPKRSFPNFSPEKNVHSSYLQYPRNPSHNSCYYTSHTEKYSNLPCITSQTRRNNLISPKCLTHSTWAFLNPQNCVAEPGEHFMISPKYITQQSGKS